MALQDSSRPEEETGDCTGSFRTRYNPEVAHWEQMEDAGSHLSSTRWELQLVDSLNRSLRLAPCWVGHSGGHQSARKGPHTPKNPSSRHARNANLPPRCRVGECETGSAAFCAGAAPREHLRQVFYICLRDDRLTRSRQEQRRRNS